MKFLFRLFCTQLLLTAAIFYIYFTLILSKTSSVSETSKHLFFKQSNRSVERIKYHDAINEIRYAAKIKKLQDEVSAIADTLKNNSNAINKLKITNQKWTGIAENERMEKITLKKIYSSSNQQTINHLKVYLGVPCVNLHLNKDIIVRNKCPRAKGHFAAFYAGPHSTPSIDVASGIYKEPKDEQHTEDYIGNNIAFHEYILRNGMCTSKPNEAMAVLYTKVTLKIGDTSPTNLLAVDDPLVDIACRHSLPLITFGFAWRGYSPELIKNNRCNVRVVQLGWEYGADVMVPYPLPLLTNSNSVQGNRFKYPYPIIEDIGKNRRLEYFVCFVGNLDTGKGMIDKGRRRQVVTSIVAASRKLSRRNVWPLYFPQLQYINYNFSLTTTGRNWFDVYFNSVFCFIGEGDSRTRKAFYDSILCGCVPIIYSTTVETYSKLLGRKIFGPDGLVGPIDEIAVVLTDDQQEYSLNNGYVILSVLNSYTPQDISLRRQLMYKALKLLAPAREMEPMNLFSLSLSEALNVFLKKSEPASSSMRLQKQLKLGLCYEVKDKMTSNRTTINTTNSEVAKAYNYDCPFVDEKTSPSCFFELYNKTSRQAMKI
jgi:hypothetical protein